MSIKKYISIPGIILAIVSGVITLLLSNLFFSFLTNSELLPEKHLNIIYAALTLLSLIIAILFCFCRKKACCISAIALSVISWALLIWGTYAIDAGVDTLEEISSPTTETAAISVYVAVDDPARTIEDAADYTFGILSSLDRDKTDQAVSAIDKILGKEISTTEYEGIIDLSDALLHDGTIQAIILNAGYLDIYDDLSAYDDVTAELRELDTIEISSGISQAQNSDTAEVSVAAGNFVTADTPARQDRAETSSVSEEASAADEVPVEDFTAESVKDYCFTTYISGIDSRGGLIALSRSDVNILAIVNVATKTILLVSTPRDYYVPLTISDGACDKLTHAGIYGIDVCVGTMEMLYDTDIDYYFRCNFTGFESIVDALGGVTVYSDQSFTSTIGSYPFSEGKNSVNGAQALAFARERNAFASGDRQRGKNQMAMIKAIATKAMSPALLLNYNAVLSSLSGAFETTMSYSLISALVNEQLDSGTAWTMLSYSVDGTGASKKPYSLDTNAYVMVPDEETVAYAESLIKRVQDGEILTQEDIG